MLLVPAMPTILEIVRAKDDGRLRISEQYVRDPRWFGNSFRAMLAPFVATARGNAAFHENVEFRTVEETRWDADLMVPSHERLRGIAVGERVRVGQGAGIRDAYALESLDVEQRVVARTLTSNGVMHIGDAVTILRWIDAEGEITVGDDTNLAVSASSGARLTLGARVHFERVWGRPTASRTTATEPFPFAGREAARIEQGDADRTTSLIVYGAARIARDTHIVSHVKVHGSLEVESGVRIGGNVIARGDVTFVADVVVLGHVFAEGNVRLGPGTRVGRSDGIKTVYAAGNVFVANDVEVEGWLVADDGGKTV